MEENALKPVLDEADIVRSRSGLHAKPGFQACQRAGEADPGLSNDDGNCNDMSEPEPETVYRWPCKQIARKNGRETADNEYDDADMRQQHHIRQIPIVYASSLYVDGVHLFKEVMRLQYPLISRCREARRHEGYLGPSLGVIALFRHALASQGCRSSGNPGGR